MSGFHRNTVEWMIGAAISATRCRHATRETNDPALISALSRAADRYSGRVAELAEEMLAEGRSR